MNYRRLGDFVELSQGLAVNKGTAHFLSNTKTPEFPYPLLRIVDFGNDEHDNYSKYVSKDISKSMLIDDKSIVFTRVTGECFRGFSGVLHNNLFNVKLTSDEITEDYLFTVLQSDFIKKQAFKAMSSSVVPDLSHEKFKSMIIPVPDKNTQREISNVYLSLVEKIKNNNFIIAELDAMAKTLYDYWFLQFEFPNEEGKPYKSSGGKMVYNEQLKREIPEGWEVKKLGELLTKQNRNFNYDKVVNTVDLSIMPTNSLSLNELNKSNLFDTNLFGLKKYDILFGSIRPYLKKACIAPCDGAVAGTVHCYTVNKESDYNFSLITLCSDNLFKFAVNNSKGTKMPVVSSDDLLEYLVVYNEDTVELFNSLNLKKIISNNIIQNQELTSLRDFLLPLLMNGQVTFKNEKEELENKVKQAIILSYAERFNQWKRSQGYAARGDVDDEILKKIFDAMDEDDKK